MARTIPVRIDRETLEALDLFVTLGFYRNRSDAIRELLAKGLESRKEMGELGKLVKMVESLDRQGKMSVSWADLQRDRFT